jgi:hypothetical protein
MRIVVTAYRHWQNPRTVWNRMQRLQDQCALERSGLEVAVGDCPTGGDLFVRDWAVTAPVALRVFHADWDRYGHAAGPIRNKEMINTMLREGGVDKVVAFLHPLSLGASGCAEYAASLGLTVERIWEGR